MTPLLINFRIDVSYGGLSSSNNFSINDRNMVRNIDINNDCLHPMILVLFQMMPAGL
jgi:hypothetical protein